MPSLAELKRTVIDVLIDLELITKEEAASYRTSEDTVNQYLLNRNSTVD